MELEMHPSVKKVVEFMQRNIPADELRGIANCLAIVAPAIWGTYPNAEITAMRLSQPPITSSHEKSGQQSISIGSFPAAVCADGDSAVANGDRE